MWKNNFYEGKNAAKYIYLFKHNYVLNLYYVSGATQGKALEWWISFYENRRQKSKQINKPCLQMVITAMKKDSKKRQHIGAD